MVRAGGEDEDELAEGFPDRRMEAGRDGGAGGWWWWWSISFRRSKSKPDFERETFLRAGIGR